MKASDYIADFFERRGVNVIFGYIGGMITHLVDSIDRNPGLRFIQTYHEQTAAIAAEGFALESGLPGVAIATSGPGATNLITGIADAYFGSIPVIFITGQVNTYEYKYDKPIRQQGFQETDVVSIVRPITKYAVMVDEPSELRYELEKAWNIAVSGRKGPVLIDLPMNISRADIDPDLLKSFDASGDVISPSSPVQWDEIAQKIQSAHRPLILIGGGCQGKSAEIDRLLQHSGVPFVCSLMGRGVADESLPGYSGMIGSYGNRCANMIVSQCDLLITLGSRLDTRQTGAKIEAFNPHAEIIHVDIDKGELESHRLKNRTKVWCEVSDFIEGLIGRGIEFSSSRRWAVNVREICEKYSQEHEVERFVENKAPYRFFEIFNKVKKPGSIITADIGQNQMWVAQSVDLGKGCHFFTSGGLAPMGFSLPAAIGAAFASPGKTVYCFNGDGGFHMACQSLLLISQYQLDIKVIVMNNKALGMITQFQHLYFNDNMAATIAAGGYLTPDLKAMSQAYRLPYKRLYPDKLTIESMEDAFSGNAVIVDYLIDGLTTVSPKLEYNQPIYNPTPLLPEDELGEVMERYEY